MKRERGVRRFGCAAKAARRMRGGPSAGIAQANLPNHLTPLCSKDRIGERWGKVHRKKWADWDCTIQTCEYLEQLYLKEENQEAAEHCAGLRFQAEKKLKKTGASCIIMDGAAPLKVQRAAHRF